MTYLLLTLLLYSAYIFLTLNLLVDDWSSLVVNESILKDAAGPDLEFGLVCFGPVQASAMCVYLSWIYPFYYPI